MSSTLLDRPPRVRDTVATHPVLARGLSRRGWARIQKSVTVGLFVVATVAGIVIGMGAPEISPVVPPATLIAAPAVEPPAAAPAVPLTVPQNSAPGDTIQDPRSGRRGQNQPGPGGRR